MTSDLLFSSVELNARGDERGVLVAIEGGIDVPFEIARVYYIIGADGMSRGFHAHRELSQLLICIRGSCRLVVDDGIARDERLLDKSDIGVLVEPMKWHEMHDFSSDSVLLVLASAHYDEADYIRDYPAFLAEVQDSIAS